MQKQGGKPRGTQAKTEKKNWILVCFDPSNATQGDGLENSWSGSEWLKVFKFVPRLRVNW